MREKYNPQNQQKKGFTKRHQKSDAYIREGANFAALLGRKVEEEDDTKEEKKEEEGQSSAVEAK